MSQSIKLSDVPCTVQDKLSNPTELGTRVSDVLKRINFPNRDKFILYLGFDMMGWPYFQLQIGVDDIRSGAPISLGHNRRLPSPNPTDREIAREFFILVGQFVCHEFAETYRFDGQIMFDPHQGSRNEKMFSAIESLAQDVQPPMAFQFEVVVPFPEPKKESTPEPQNGTGAKKEKEHPFARFMPKSWQERKRAA